MKKNNPVLKFYLKATAWSTVLLMSLAFVFVPLMPTILGLTGFQSFFGITFTGETEKTYVNVLLMGLDKEETRSDVMMIAQLNLVNNGINILQIPRDTYINNKRYDKKINSAYGEGGPENSIKEIQTILDIDIDKYAIVTTSGFRDVIDAVGGVYYDVPQDMDYDDPYQDLHIHLKKGYQLLDGDKAEQYVRCRSIYSTGDIGRVEAQSGFIKEAIRQIIEKYQGESDVDTEKLITELGDMVDTNFEFAEIIKYAPFLLNINMDNVNIMMIDGVPEYRNGISYFIANNKKNAQIIREYFTPDISEADLSEIKARDDALGKNYTSGKTVDAPEVLIHPSEINVYILDYSGTDGENLSETQAMLESLEYKVVGSVVAKTTTADKTYCIGNPGSQLSSKVAQSLGIEDYYVNPDFNNDADVVIILGKEE